MSLEIPQVRDAVASILQITALAWAILVIGAESRRNLAGGDLAALVAKVACVAVVSFAVSVWAPSTGAMIVTAILATQGLIVGVLWLLDARQQGMNRQHAKKRGIGPIACK